LIIESSQVFLSPLIPDVWDIFVYALGGLLGYHLLQTVLMEPQVAKDDLSTKVC
jgi:glycopeptide antibiotics resistance protein